jgi:hypothetical protein
MSTCFGGVFNRNNIFISYSPFHVTTCFSLYGPSSSAIYTVVFWSYYAHTVCVYFTCWWPAEAETCDVKSRIRNKNCCYLRHPTKQVTVTDVTGWNPQKLKANYVPYDRRPRKIASSSVVNTGSNIFSLSPLPPYPSYPSYENHWSRDDYKLSTSMYLTVSIVTIRVSWC